MTLKMLKKMQYIKNAFFRVFIVFLLFLVFFWKFIKNMGKKLGSNKCPLFTMLTKQNILNVLHSKLCKENLRSSWLAEWSTHLITLSFFFSFFFLFFFFFLSFSLSFSSFWVNLRSHMAISFNQNQNRCVAQSTWNPIWRFPLTKAKLCVWLG